MPESHFLVELLLIVGMATLVAIVSNALRVPLIAGLTVAGALIGPFGMGLVTNLPGARVITEIAGILLMFTLGLEHSFTRLRSYGRLFMTLGTFQVVGTVLVVALLLMVLAGQPIQKSFFVGFLVALIYKALVMRLLEDSRDTATPYGNASLGVLLFQDLAFVPMMLLIPIVLVRESAPELEASRIGLQTVLFLLVLGFLWLANRSIIPFVMERVAVIRSREVFFFGTALVCLGVAYCVSWAGLPLELGAFLSGLMLAESPYGKQAAADLLLLRDSFLSLFFFSVGMLLNIQLLFASPLYIFGLGVAGFFIKAIVIYISMRMVKVPHGSSLVCALILCQVGEFSFFMADAGFAKGLINQDEYQMFLGVSVLSMIATPFLYLLAPKIAQISIEDHKSMGDHKKSDLHSHVVLIGYGHAGKSVAEELKRSNTPYALVEMNYSQVRKLRKQGEKIIFGDASKEVVLDSAGVARAKLVVITVHGVKTTRAIFNSVRRVAPETPVIVRFQFAQELESFHLDPKTKGIVSEIEATTRIVAQVKESLAGLR